MAISPKPLPSWALHVPPSTADWKNMGFKDFRTRVLLKLLGISISMFLLIYLIVVEEKYVTSLLILFFLVYQLVQLFLFVEQTNQKLARFFDSVKYSDFLLGFTVDNKLGESFKNLNRSFTEVIEAFRKAREEKEEHLLYLQTVVQHINIGLLSFDNEGHVQLINTTAKRFLQKSQVKNISDIATSNPDLYEILRDIEPGGKHLMKADNEVQLNINATGMRIRGHYLKLVTLQNIRTELEAKEAEAWQNLSRVLRHEIMNSITPIASLSTTLNSILKEEIYKEDTYYRMDEYAREDLTEGLETIENRSKGLIRFIDSYRDYTSIPQPKLQRVQVKSLIDHLAQLLNPDLQEAGIALHTEVIPTSLEVQLDAELIEMVLINLIKNAKEALHEVREPEINLTAHLDHEQHVIIKVHDNGAGIIPEAIDKIFIPFYSTKKTGSGIGLALSRQIMQLHGGSITVESEPGVSTQFVLRF
ncbi:ATP-binding protein [Cytophagales bacterium LB-30]|uniref:histidine kinase n=1 Tax=Shiella aurantiaca TaxID=3058365 RepID=A0ABT8F3J8_9BACT|nr:ATP-binding protein [Shiella aurantiaca]MDN4165042.1 ATP-binding protein [Shiella aurantiaca]